VLCLKKKIRGKDKSGCTTVSTGSNRIMLCTAIVYPWSSRNPERRIKACGWLDLMPTIRNGLHTFVAADEIQAGDLSGFVDGRVVHVVVVHIDLDMEGELN